MLLRTQFEVQCIECVDFIFADYAVQIILHFYLKQEWAIVDRFCTMTHIYTIKTSFTFIKAQMGIPSDKYQEDWKTRLRWEKGLFFTNFRSGTHAIFLTSPDDEPEFRIENSLKINLFPTQPQLPVFFIIHIIDWKGNYDEKSNSATKFSIFLLFFVSLYSSSCLVLSNKQFWF